MKIRVEVEIPDGTFCDYCKFLDSQRDPINPFYIHFSCQLYKKPIRKDRVKTKECLEAQRI